MKQVWACAFFLLPACQQSEKVDRADYDKLQSRVMQLEAKMAELPNHAETVPTASTPASTSVSSVAPKATYQLIGTSFRNEGTFRYSGKTDCEEAKQALLEDWRAQDQKNRELGIIQSHPTPSCLPL